MGGGLAGLSAGFALAGRRVPALVLEAGPRAGGLARTVEAGGVRFDLGGHRFHTADQEVLALVRKLLGSELRSVQRRSTILKDGRHFEYPLQALNALMGAGPARALAMIASYGRQRLRGPWRRPEPATFEDWVVSRFGRALFKDFFEQYSEKVWGLPCRGLAAELAAKRIGALSLGGALRHALGASGGPGLPPESFLYPALGIGRLADRLAEGLQAAGGRFKTDSPVVRLFHDGRRVLGLATGGGRGPAEVTGKRFISTIPLTHLLTMLDPPAPPEVREAAGRLRYRDLIVVALEVARPRVCGQTWIYLPDRAIPFGRLHETANWSPDLAGPGRTVLVAEYFCFQGDPFWNTPDSRLAESAETHLRALGLIKRGEVTASRVERAPEAYPIPQTGQEKAYALVMRYLQGLVNLTLIGRTGRFQYLNMDEAMRQGLDAAEELAGAEAAAGLRRQSA